jgi:hypothetical protein
MVGVRGMEMLWWSERKRLDRNENVEKRDGQGRIV